MDGKHFSGQYQDDRPLVPVPPKLVKVPADPVAAIPEWHDPFSTAGMPYVENTLRHHGHQNYQRNLLSGLRAKRGDAQQMD